MERNSPHKESLKTQIREAYGRVTYTYTSQLQMMNRLTKKYKNTKLFQIALSAVSTGGFVSAVITNEPALSIVGGLFSTLLLAVNLYIKDFDLFDEIKQHRAASDSLWLIRERYISLLTDLPILAEDEIIHRRDDLQSRTHEIYEQSPKTDVKSYTDAQRALKNEEEQFFTSKELDMMLPSHLRCGDSSSLSRLESSPEKVS